MFQQEIEYDREENVRIDKYLASIDNRFSRSLWAKYVTSGNVLLNHSKVDKKAVLRPTDVITIDIPDREVIAVEIPILLQEECFIAVNKPAGLLSTAKDGKDSEFTTEEYAKDFSNNASLNPLVHRLDRQTSGVMILAMNDKCRNTLQKLFSERQINKYYIAIVPVGFKEDHVRVSAPLMRSPKKGFKQKIDANGKEALTEFRLIASKGEYSVILAMPKTGRTHQIRAHLAHLGSPIVGDSLYGSKHDLTNNRFLLHSYKIDFSLMGNDYSIKAPLPEDMTNFIEEDKIESFIA